MAGSILSGRYPYHIGMYNNNGLQQGVNLNISLLPSVLSKHAGWATHAFGKVRAVLIFLALTLIWQISGT